jgi:hypothetical protein
MDKIFDDSVKTFEIPNAELFILDAESQDGYDFSNCVPDFSKNPVNVLNESGDVIGACDLALYGGSICGRIFLDYSCPERLDIETKAVPMYPKLDMDMEVVKEQGIRHVILVRVNQVTLTIIPLNDFRINSL